MNIVVQVSALNLREKKIISSPRSTGSCRQRNMVQRVRKEERVGLLVKKSMTCPWFIYFMVDRLTHWVQTNLTQQKPRLNSQKANIAICLQNLASYWVQGILTLKTLASFARLWSPGTVIPPAPTACHCTRLNNHLNWKFRVLQYRDRCWAGECEPGKS